jgi:uncharacterized protein (DUF58 family)
VGHFKSLYFTNRVFVSAFAVIILFVLAYMIPFFYLIAQLGLVLTVAALIYDIFLLYASGKSVIATRLCAHRFSNGDENEVQIIAENKYSISVNVSIIDEIPFQFQRRDIHFDASIKAGESSVIRYHLRPVERGVYSFGLLRVYVMTGIGMAKRRFNCDTPKDIKVYPSFLQIRKYELMAISNHLTELGIKKVRKIGHNIEFEHIKEYVKGDDFRTVNWKATARKNELMVNLYQDEKSQNVYSLIDKGRMMKMPFEGMSLLDYAINSSLIFSKIAIKKEDKAGIMTFEKSFDGYLPADKKRHQMHLILDFLYNQSTTFGETDYSSLYVQLKHRLKRRSLLMLYTNFESIHSLDRQLPYFIKLAKSHLLVVIFFENTELNRLMHEQPGNTLEVYQKVMAEQFAFEKSQIVNTLRKHGIQTILTKPADLSIMVINKYIELKARQMI